MNERGDVEAELPSREILRKQASEIAGFEAQRPATRNVIVVRLFPNGSTAVSFNSTKDADTYMALQREAGAKARARGQEDATFYVAYFEKATLRMLLDWDKWQDMQEPPQWQAPAAPLPWWGYAIAGVGVFLAGAQAVAALQMASASYQPRKRR